MDERLAEWWPRILTALKVVGEVRIAAEKWWADCPANNDETFRADELPELLEWLADKLRDPDRELYAWFDLPQDWPVWSDEREEVVRGYH